MKIVLDWRNVNKSTESELFYSETIFLSERKIYLERKSNPENMTYKIDALEIKRLRLSRQFFTQAESKSADRFSSWLA